MQKLTFSLKQVFNPAHFNCSQTMFLCFVCEIQQRMTDMAVFPKEDEESSVYICREKSSKVSGSPRRAAIPHTLSAAVLFFIHVDLPSQQFEWQVRLSTLWTLSGYWRSSLNWSSVISRRLAESVGKWEQGVALLWMNKEPSDRKV